MPAWNGRAWTLSPSQSPPVSVCLRLSRSDGESEVRFAVGLLLFFVLCSLLVARVRSVGPSTGSEGE